MILTGILLGLAAAAVQSLGYLFTRLFVIRTHDNVIRLLVLAHLAMGAVSLVLLPLLWPVHMPPVSAYAGSLAGTAAFYLLGQASLFWVLRHAEASRVAPLLGLKIVILAVLSTIFLSAHLATVQWLAVAVSVGTAFVLNQAGGGLRPRAIAGLLFTCVTYSLSDLSIKRLMVALAPAGSMLQVSLLGVLLCYGVCGLAGLVLLRWALPIQRTDWVYSLPFAACWLGAMILLFASFACIGVIYGNIVQATRGLMSIVIGAHLAEAGMAHLEMKVPRSVFWRRAAAALMMVAAIALYALGQNRH